MITLGIFYNNGILNKNKLRQKWFEKHQPSDYDNINYFFITNPQITKNFSQKIYNCINNIRKISLCKECNNTNCRFLGFERGYNEFCSKKCASSHTRPQVEKTRRENTIIKHGVEHTSQLKIVKEKQKLTNINKWGFVSPAAAESVKKKQKETNLDRYGVEYTYFNDDIRNKMIKTRYNKYNSYIKQLYPDLDINVIRESEFQIKCDKCKKTFNISSVLLRHRKLLYKTELCTICNPIGSYKITSGHQEIIDYINSLGIKCLINDRSILNGKEIDIYLPDHRIGIEYNGVYWHSEIHKPKNYHIEKYKLADKNDCKLLQIWGDDWSSKSEIIKSRIRYLIHKTDKIWARKCQIRKVTDKDSKIFLNRNHLQGWCVSKHRYGLYYNNELVSIMTFGKLRINLGSKGSSSEYELLRFCNLIGNSVIGGASRLLKYFIMEIKPSSISTWSTNDWSFTDFYQKIGFTKIKTSEPNYFWSDKEIRHNRWNFRKDKLIKDGYSPEISEVEIMHQRGYFRCWDSGNTLYKYVV